MSRSTAILESARGRQPWRRSLASAASILAVIMLREFAVAPPARAAAEDLPGSLVQARAMGLNETDPAWLGTIREAGVSSWDLRLPPAPRDPAADIDVERARSIAAARARWEWGTEGRIVSLTPVLDIDGRVTAYDVDLTLDGSDFDSYNSLASGWEAFVKNRQDDPTPREEVFVPFATVVVSATYDRPPILSSHLGVSSCYRSGWLAAGIAARVLGTPAPVLQGLVLLTANERFYEFSAGSRTILVQGDLPWTWGEKEPRLRQWRENRDAGREEAGARLAATGKTLPAYMDSLRAYHLSCADRWIDGSFPKRSDVFIQGYTTCFIVQEMALDRAETCLSQRMNYYDERLFYGMLTNYYMNFYNPHWSVNCCHTPDLDFEWTNFITDLVDPDEYYYGMRNLALAKGYLFSGGIHMVGNLLDWGADEGQAEIDASHPFVWTEYYRMFDAYFPHTAVGYDTAPEPDEWLVHTPVFNSQLWPSLIRQSVEMWPDDWVYFAGPHDGGGGYATAEITTPDGNPNWGNCSPGSPVAAWDTYTIRWDQRGSPGHHVTLELSTDGGSAWTQLVANRPDVGWYNWTPSCDLISDECRIRIKQYDGAGELLSADGSRGNFSIVDPPCPAPVLMSPYQGQSCVSPLSGTLEWSAMGCANLYNLKLGTTCGAGDIVQTAAHTYPYANLSPGTTYYWQVQCVNECGHPMQWSACSSFTTGPATLAPPALTSPSDGATCQGTSGTLAWSSVAGATGYTLQIGPSCECATWLYDVSATSYAYSFLTPGTTYYWRVRTKDACQNPGAWSACRHFTVVSAPLASPALLSPVDGSMIERTAGTLDWTDVGGAAGYRVRIGTTCGTGTVYTIDSPTSQYAYSGLADETIYYWQVATKDNCGQWGSYSACFYFRTRDPATFTVRPDGGGTHATIQAAINAALNGDVIELTDGTFSGAGNRDLVWNGKAITIRSQSGNPQACVINCQGTDSEMHRGFSCYSLTASALLDGIGITYGFYTYGGGMYLNDASTGPTIHNCRFNLNYCTVGGGAIWCGNGAAPTFSDCDIYGNVSYGSGGGIYCSGSTPTLSACKLRLNNAAQGGGGMYCWYATPVLAGTTFQGNSAQDGGGLYATHSSPHPTDCLFCGNSAATAGGGVNCTSAGNLTFTRCTFSENEAPTGGTIGLFMGSTIAMDHSIVSFAYLGGSIHCDGTSQANLSCCDVYGNAGGDWIGCIASQSASNGNFGADPLYCSPALANFHLHLDSPCAPANNPACGQVGALGVACGPASPVEVWVSSDGSGTYPTIQAALDDIPSGSTIYLADGIYRGDGNRDLMWNGKSITLRSETDDPPSCVIDCQGSAAEPHRGFDLNFGEGPGCVIQGITVRNGFAVEKGGGLLTQYGNAPTIRHCIFESCVAGSWGGAVYTYYNAHPTFEDCIFRNNASMSYGGAVDFWTGCSPAFVRCVFEDNLSADGGAVDIYDNSHPTFDGCTFSGNGAALGGAVFCDTGCQPVFSNCTFQGNEAPLNSRRALPDVGPQEAADSVRRAPEARGPGAGGAIFSTWSATVHVANSIIAFGEAGEAVACASGGAVELTCSDVFGNPGGDWVGCIADQAGQNGNFSADPQFCWAEEGELTLRVDSPCAPEHAPECGLIGAHPVACGYHHLLEADGSGEYPTIQAAVNAVPANDVIDLADGVYTGPGNRDVYFFGKRLTVRSESGDPTGCIIDCQGTAAENHRGFNFRSQEPAGTLLEGVTVRNGYHEAGGAVMVSVATSCPTIRNCRFHGGTSVGGGAVYIADGSPVVEDCTIYDNTANLGGGIFVIYGSPQIARCTITGNHANLNGAGIYQSTDAHFTVANSIIAWNDGGPGVVCEGTPHVQLLCTDVYGNSGGDWVGCIADQAGVSGNLSLDPLFCDAAGDDYTLHSDSPCADDFNPACGRIGSEPVQCESSAAPETQRVPDRFFLGPCSPNPFGRGTTIAYGLPSGARDVRVELAIFNVAGQRVRTLVRENQAPGFYRLAWDGDGEDGEALGSGVYFARLQAGSSRESHRLVLMR